jgi:hypothetical protein
MKTTVVEDVMLPLVDVPTIPEDATLADAVLALDRAQHRRPAGRLPFRVILAVNSHGHVVGKLGHLAFVQALEPGFEPPEERETLQRAGVDPALVESLSQYRRFWEGDLELACRRAANLRVGDVMRGVGESVDVSMPLLQAISTLVRLGTLSVLVRRGDLAVGLLRLADVYEYAARLIAQDPGTENDGSD